MYQLICKLDDVWEGEIVEFSIGDTDVIVVNPEGGQLCAFNARCPHQDQSLAAAELDGSILTCPAHLWQFDTHTGQGVNPTGCRLHSYPLKVEGENVLIDLSTTTSEQGQTA